MSLERLTPSAKAQSLRTRYPAHAQPGQPTAIVEPVTKCTSCVHRPDLSYDCQQWAQTTGGLRGFLIVLQCEGYEVV